MAWTDSCRVREHGACDGRASSPHMFPGRAPVRSACGCPCHMGFPRLGRVRVAGVSYPNSWVEPGRTIELRY